MKKIIITLCCLFGFWVSIYGQGKPKNIILMIGDGMGKKQVECLEYIKNGELGNMMRFPYQGTSRTQSLSDTVTDSAAGGSAISTGKKTVNGHLAITAEGITNETIMEWAAQHNLATGIIVTSHITDATPASFYAHVTSRKNREEIARQLVYADVDIVLGGDKQNFLPEKRKDRKNLIDSLQAQGFTVYFTLDDFATSKAAKPIALLSDNYPPLYSQRGEWLKVGLEAALAKLSQSEEGFFLMVEGSQIDWACHNNDFPYFVEEILEFDAAVEQAYQFAQMNKETLVIVTADHETGGMGIKEEIKRVKPQKQSKKIERYVTWTHGNHTGRSVGVYAYGPGAELFQGEMENTVLYDLMRQLLAK